jgi:hypothetical protein
MKMLFTSSLLGKIRLDLLKISLHNWFSSLIYSLALTDHQLRVAMAQHGVNNGHQTHIHLDSTQYQA